jgi:hypothetical protein
LSTGVYLAKNRIVAIIPMQTFGFDRVSKQGDDSMTENLMRLNRNKKENSWWHRFLEKLAKANKEALKSGCKT